MSKDYLKELERPLTPLLLMEEASRCLLCLDAPCSKACPAGTDPAKFIRSVRFKNLKGAAYTVGINNPLGAICARVCPTERYCELGCSRSGIDKPINIGAIQRYITDNEDVLSLNILEAGKRSGKRVAIVGSGPSALSLAALLRKDGHSVDIYEKDEKLGGYLRYGIPEYRLPTPILDREIDRIINLGVKVHLKAKINNSKLEKLKEKFDVVVLATGNSKGKTLPLFAKKKNVRIAVDLLKEIKDNQGDINLPNNIVIIGGGDVAMDVATSLKLLGVKHVTDVVFESLEEFKASKKELEGARNVGVTIIDGYVPTSYKPKDCKITFSSRFIDSTITIKADMVVLAVGQITDLGDMDISLDKGEVTCPNYRVCDSNVFFIGDISHNEKTVVYAVRSAKEAYKQIKDFLGE